LISWIDGTDRYSVNTLGEEVVNDALLSRGSSIRCDSEFDFDARDLLGRLFGSFAGYGPEVGSVIRDKCQFMFAARCGGAATTTTWFPIAREKEKRAN
jgi:hypothetical protein